MHHSRLCSLLRSARRSSLVILCYHRVLPAGERSQYSFPDLVVTPEIFRQHVAFSAEHYDCLTLSQAMQRWPTRHSSDKPMLAFTFDDGYADNFRYAVPILNEFGASGTFFIISSLNDTNTTAWYDRLARAVQTLSHDALDLPSKLNNASEADRWLAQHLQSQSHSATASIVSAAKKLGTQQRLAVVKRAAGLAGLQKGTNGESGHDKSNDDKSGHGDPDKMMSLSEIKKLIEQDHEVGAHTRTHPILTQLEDDELALELEGSRNDLSNAIGSEVTSLAYPNGDFNGRVIEATRHAGYLNAVTTMPGLNHRSADTLTLRRVYISQDRLADACGGFSRSLFQLELSGAADALYLRKWRRGAKA